MRPQDKSFDKTVGKGEIAHNEQYLLFPYRFFLPFSPKKFRHFIEFKIVFFWKLVQFWRV